jgi:hypothetical protein
MVCAVALTLSWTLRPVRRRRTTLGFRAGARLRKSLASEASLDLFMPVRELIARKMENTGVPRQRTAAIRGFIPVGRSDRASLYDESLPPGLILGTGQDESMPDKGAERPGRSDAIGPQCAVPLQPELTRFDCPGMHREVSRNDREVDHGEEGDEGKEESRCSKKDDEICPEEVSQENCGEARSRQGACQEGQGRGTQANRQEYEGDNRQEGDRQGACQEGPGRQISGTQTNRQEGDRHGACQEGRDRHISGTQASREEAGACQKTVCSGDSRNAGRASRAEASSRRRAETVRAAVASRRSRAGNGTAAARRAAARGSPVAYGAKARNAGPAFGS